MKRKKRADFTIDQELLERFRGYCKQNNIKMSNVIENLIKTTVGYEEKEHKKHIQAYTG
ncbi:MAG TPA: hypothetical protein VJB94_05725 [Candidatus Nanoarchaeia archaeon]|nr:hypothetical protein [Candidatus Nanoarchaeia archaeon]